MMQSNDLSDDEVRDEEISDELNSSDDIDESFDTQSTVPPRDERRYSVSLDNALAAARCADELRGRDVVVLDLTGQTSIVDFFVIVTGTSRRQMHAIADEVNRLLKGERGNQRISIEGYRTEGNWVLTDYGDVVLHVFTPEGRELYNLEGLWGDATRVDWQPLERPAEIAMDGVRPDETPDNEA